MGRKGLAARRGRDQRAMAGRLCMVSARAGFRGAERRLMCLYYITNRSDPVWGRQEIGGSVLVAKYTEIR